MIMKKVLSIMLILTVCACLFAGCTKKEGNDSSETTSTVESEALREETNDLSSEISSSKNNSTSSEISSSNTSSKYTPPTPPTPPRYVKSKVETEGKKLVAFALDDAPNSITQDLIDVFYDNGVHATFFIVGKNATLAYKQTLNNAIDAGMELGNHSYTHTNFTKGSTQSEIMNDFIKCQDRVKEYTNYTMKIARLPELAGNDTVYSALSELSLPMISATQYTNIHDYRSDFTSDDFILNVNNSVRDGVIYCCHNVPNTLEALKTLIPELKAKGFAMVTVSEMFEAKGLTMPLGAQIRGTSVVDGSIVTYK